MKTARQLTAAERAAELKRLVAMPDSDIDTSDIPEVTDWRGAEVGKFYRPVKKQVTLPIDADVLDWFKAKGGKDQTEINKDLRTHALSQSGRSTRLVAKNNMPQSPQRAIDDPQIGSAVDIPPVATNANRIAYSLDRSSGRRIVLADSTMHWSENAHGIDFPRRQSNRTTPSADTARRAIISSSCVPRTRDEVQFRQVPR